MTAASVEYSLAIAASRLNGRPVVLQPGGSVGEHASSVGHDREVGAWERDALVRADRLAERVAALGVRDSVLEAGLHDADRERRDRDAAVVEDREEVAEPAAPLAEEVLLGHAAAVEREAVRVGGVPAHLPIRRHRR